MLFQCKYCLFKGLHNLNYCHYRQGEIKAKYEDLFLNHQTIKANISMIVKARVRHFGKYT